MKDRRRPANANPADCLQRIVNAIQEFSEAKQAEVIRRLRNPDADLAIVLAAWPRLPDSTRRAIAPFTRPQAAEQ